MDVTFYKGSGVSSFTNEEAQMSTEMAKFVVVGCIACKLFSLVNPVYFTFPLAASFLNTKTWKQITDYSLSGIKTVIQFVLGERYPEVSQKVMDWKIFRQKEDFLDQEKYNQYKKLQELVEKRSKFVFKKEGDGKFSVFETSWSGNLDQGIEDEKRSVSFLLGVIYNPSTSREEREIALQTAFLLKQFLCYEGLSWTDYLNTPFPRTTENVLFSELQKFAEAKKIVALAKKLNIPEEFFFKDLQLYSFMRKNGLHFKITPGTVDCGFGPKVENGKVLFPFTEDDRTAKFIPYSDLITDQKGVVQAKWTGHGFLRLSKAEKGLYSCRLEPIFSEGEKIPEGKYAVDYVTKSPEWSVSKLLQWPFGPFTHFAKAGFGHSWIQIRQTVYPKGGKAPYNVVMSVGNRAGAGRFFGGKIVSPDFREFKKDRAVAIRIFLSKEDGENFISTIQKKRNGRVGLKDIELLQDLANVDRGTCVNFASDVFRDATNKKIVFNSRYEWQKILLSIGNFPVLGPLVNKIMPNTIKNLLGKITHGELPWLAIERQRSLAKTGKRIGNTSVFVVNPHANLK